MNSLTDPAGNRWSPRRFGLPALAMAIVVLASNVLVNYPINDWLVWGAITYPFAFLVTDLVNRRFGVGAARRVVLVGFALGVLASLFVDPRIAVASGTAFLVAQLLDVQLFDALRSRAWWIAPVLSTFFGAIVDTVLFFSLAFGGTGTPWMQWAIGDLGVKWAVALVSLLPYRLVVVHWRAQVSSNDRISPRC